MHGDSGHHAFFPDILGVGCMVTRVTMPFYQIFWGWMHGEPGHYAFSPDILA
jgi:hypothetical protein